MDETTKKVFRDNVYMSDAIGLHMERREELEKENKKLSLLYRKLKQEAEINEITGT